jgi:hypothetical protein
MRSYALTSENAATAQVKRYMKHHFEMMIHLYIIQASTQLTTAYLACIEATIHALLNASSIYALPGIGTRETEQYASSQSIITSFSA